MQVTPTETPGSAPAFSAVLPDPKICRSSAIRGGVEQFAHCHVENPYGCVYLTFFRDGYVCSHPGWKTFAKESGMANE